MTSPDPAPPAARTPAASATTYPGTVARWSGAVALAGLAVGVAEAAGLGGIATLLLPGLLIGLAQRAAVPGRIPAVWTLFSGLAWVAGVLLDATLALRLEGVGLWLIPTATMAAWQTFLLPDLRRAWLWFPLNLLAAAVLQLTAQGACAIGCAWLAQTIAPSAATLWTYLAGFFGFGLATGLAFPYLARAPRA